METFLLSAEKKEAFFQKRKTALKQEAPEEMRNQISYKFSQLTTTILLNKNDSLTMFLN